MSNSSFYSKLSIGFSLTNLTQCILLFNIFLLGMLFVSMNFDLIVATSIGDSIVTNRMLKGCLVMIEYRGILVDSILLDL